MTILWHAAAANIYWTIMSNYVELMVPKRANSFAHFCGTWETDSKPCLLFIEHDLIFLCVISCDKKRRASLRVLSSHEKIGQQINLYWLLVKEVKFIVMCLLLYDFWLWETCSYCLCTLKNKKKIWCWDVGSKMINFVILSPGEHSSKSNLKGDFLLLSH